MKYYSKFSKGDKVVKLDGFGDLSKKGSVIDRKNRTVVDDEYCTIVDIDYKVLWEDSSESWEYRKDLTPLEKDNYERRSWFSGRLLGTHD